MAKTNKYAVNFVFNPNAVTAKQSDFDLVTKYLGKVDDWALAKAKEALASVYSGKGTKDNSASLLSVLVNTSATGHNVRNYARHFGLTFTKDNGKYVPKSFKSQYETLKAFKDAMDDVTFADVMPKQKTKEVKKPVKIVANQEGLDELKAQMKGAIKSIKEKSAQNKLLEKYFEFCIDELFTMKHYESYKALKSAGSVRNRVKGATKA